MARAYEGMNKTAEAESVYKKAIGLRPGYWAGYNELGRFYARLAQYADAEKQFRRVVELTPDNPRAYSNLGATYSSLKQYGEAAAMFEKSIAITPTFRAYSNLGTLYFTLARYPESARNFELALKIDDRDYRVWRNLGSAYRWVPGETEKARSAFERAARMGEQELRVNPRRRTLLIHLADCYSMIGQPRRARDLLSQALSLAPDDAQAMFSAGEVYEQLEDRDRALEWIGRALRKGYSQDLVEKSPDLARLRTDPQFRKLRNR
jgi:serine/threonine-protein kinase